MDYSKIHFEKSLDNLVYQDIVNFFIEPKEESTKIEFKSFSVEYGNFNKNIEGVIRGICAMLNSEGGIIIWGAPEGVIPAGKTDKIFQGNLSSVGELKTKDWIINKVSDSITPLPIGINVSILQENQNIVYVFEIQQSTYPPHQFKNIYYARLDGQTKPAPHYLIDALFKKITFPNVEGYISLDEISHIGDTFYIDLTIYIFNFTPLQNEENVSYRLMCPQGVFAYSRVPQLAHMYLYEGHQFVSKDEISVLHFGAPSHRSFRLEFKQDQLLTNFQNQVDLILSFGGRHSPAKTSIYKMNFSNINWSNAQKPNYLFSFVEENVMIVDKQNELGTTKEKSLKEILGR